MGKCKKQRRISKALAGPPLVLAFVPVISNQNGRLFYVGVLDAIIRIYSMCLPMFLPLPYILWRIPGSVITYIIV